MKSLKVFGPAMLAALIAMAFGGASSAMAEGNTALCLEDTALLSAGSVYIETDACPPGQLITHVHELSIAKVTLLSSLDTVLCNLLILGDVTSTNNLGNPLEIEGNFAYSNCEDHPGHSCIVYETSAHALLTVLRLGHELGDVTYSHEVLWECGAFLHCKYNGVALLGHVLGVLLAGASYGETRIEEQVLTKVGGFLCAKTAKLDMLMTPLQATYISS